MIMLHLNSTCVCGLYAMCSCWRAKPGSTRVRTRINRFRTRSAEIRFCQIRIEPGFSQLTYVCKSSLPKSMQLSIYPLGQHLTFPTSRVYTTNLAKIALPQILNNIKVVDYQNHEFSMSLYFLAMGICTDRLAGCSLLVYQ